MCLWTRPYMVCMYLLLLMWFIPGAWGRGRWCNCPWWWLYPPHQGHLGNPSMQGNLSSDHWSLFIGFFLTIFSPNTLYLSSSSSSSSFSPPPPPPLPHRTSSWQHCVMLPKRKLHRRMMHWVLSWQRPRLRSSLNLSRRMPWRTLSPSS